MYIVLMSVAAAFAQSPLPDQATTLQLDSLKKANDLSNWLYLRIDYSYSKPKESLDFLMDTEKDLWRKPKSTAEKEAWLMLLSNQGYNQLYAGYILESIDRYEKAYNYYIDNKLNVEGIADYVLKPWSNNYTRLGDYEKALFIQLKTLDYAAKERNDALMVAVYNNMAISYRSMGDLQKAEHYVRQGLARSSPSSPGSILLNNTLSDIYKEKNGLDKAEQLIEANIRRQSAATPTFETAYWLLSSYISAGDIQLAKKQYAAAEKYYKLGLLLNEKYYKGNRLREKANMITQLGKVKLNQKQPAEAIRYFDQTLRSLGLFKADQSVDAAKVFGDNRIIEVFYQKALAHQLLGQEEQALENIRLALFAADKIRFELADIKTRQRFQAESKNMAGKAVDIAFRLLEKTGQHRYAETILHIFEQTKARTLLDDIRKNQQQLRLQINDTLFAQKQMLERAIAYNEKQMLQEESRQDAQSVSKNNLTLQFKLDYIEKQLRDKYPSLKQTDQPDLPNPGELLSKLPADLHFIEFFAGSDEWYGIEIKNQRIRHVKRIANAELLRQRITGFVTTYYHNGPAAMTNQPRAFFASSQSIYKTLLGGFSLNRQQKTIIIPDEVLGYLSFDGLLTDGKYNPSISKWPFLIHKAALSYAFSIQTWLNQSKKKAAASQAFSGLFITHQKGNRQFIPAVAREAEAIEKIVSGDFVKDEKATVRRFFKAFDQSSVLHISTHAYLSGQQKEPTLAFEDDQVFLFELSARKHTPALVVLSACRTADGMMAAGEGIISLSRGFAAIGAHGTIAGLWNVNDEAAAAITAESYRGLSAGKDISTALRLAKLNWLSTTRNGEQEYLPYYWDALIFMGYDQQIGLQPAGGFIQSNLTITVLISIAIAILIALIRWRPKAPRSAP
jgi:tetratricopeptide (TPR) repeat protein